MLVATSYDDWSKTMVMNGKDFEDVAGGDAQVGLCSHIGGIYNL